MNKRIITAQEVRLAVGALVARERVTQATRVWGVPRGGVPVALAVACLTGAQLVEEACQADLVVDDIYDSGRTAARYIREAQRPFAVLFDKREEGLRGQWLVLPWETTQEHDFSAEDAVVRLLQHIGEDPGREGLRQTPSRVIRAWGEWAAGYAQNPADVLQAVFTEGACDEMVIVHNVPVVSKCEHHLSDIVGIAHVGYVPNKRIVGLSKLARLVEIFARRLIVQERMTSQIADALMENLEPLGVGVLVRANHHCMSTRGVRIHGSVTTTSAMRGVLLTKPEARAEFLALCRDAKE